MKTITAIDKIDLVQQWKDSGLSRDQFCSHHGIKLKTFEDWITKKNKIDNRQPTSFHGSRGRPRLIDKKFDDELLQTIEEEGNKENCPGNVEFKKKLVAYAQQTAALQNRYKFCENISQKTINNYKNYYCINDVKGQTKSLARINAEQDPRNIFSMAVMLKSCTEFLHPLLIMNFDNSVFCR
jgi:hypothetical protein